MKTTVLQMHQGRGLEGEILLPSLQNVSEISVVGQIMALLPRHRHRPVLSLTQVPFLQALSGEAASADFKIISTKHLPGAVSLKEKVHRRPARLTGAANRPQNSNFLL